MFAYESLLDLSGDRSLDGEVGSNSIDLEEVSQRAPTMRCQDERGRRTRWKPFKFLWQVIWKIEAEPCLFYVSF